MKAMLGDAVIAEANDDDLIKIEGNWYFPPSSVTEGALVESPTAYHCPWKGDAQYFTIVAEGGEAKDGAWSYPTPYPSAFDRVGKDFSGYLAFSRDVRIVEDAP